MVEIITGKSKLSPEEVVSWINPSYRGGELFYMALSHNVDLADYIAGVSDVSKFKKNHSWSGKSPYDILFASYFLEIPINKKAPILMAETIAESDEPDVFIETIAWLGYDLNRIWIDLSWASYNTDKFLKVAKHLITAGYYPKCRYRRKILEKHGVTGLKYNISRKEFCDMIEVIYVHHS